MAGNGRRNVAVGGVLLLGMALVAGGGIAGLLLAPTAAPASLSSAPAVTQVPVEYSDFDDTRQVPFKPQVADDRELTAPRAGTVTTLACKPGGALASGDVAGSIDNTALIALHTDYPLYRDLAAGDKGPDVAALQGELTRLGYTPANNGVLDWATRQAIKAFLADRGFAKPDGTLSLLSLLPLPAQTVAISSCPAPVGTVVAAADPLIDTGGGITSLQLASSPESLTPGNRIARYQGLSAPVDAQGAVTDTAFLAALQQTDIWNGWKLSDGQAPLTLEYALATPLHTAAVPAGALFAVGAGTGCIKGPDGTHPVTIVSSSLGNTYVTIDDGAAPTTVTLATTADRTAGRTADGTARGATCS